MKFLQKIMSEMGIGHHNNNRTYESIHKSQSHHRKGYFSKPSFTPDSSSAQKCINCQNINNIDAKFCSECGASFNVVQCIGCKKKLEPSSKFCSGCGQKT